MHQEAKLIHAHDTHVYAHAPGIKWSFFTRALKHFGLFILKEFRVWRLVCYIFFALIPYFKNFAMSYGRVSAFVNKVSGPIIIYLFGTYLASLPDFVVIPLVFFPAKKVMPALVLVMCFNAVRLLMI